MASLLLVTILAAGLADCDLATRLMVLDRASIIDSRAALASSTDRSRALDELTDSNTEQVEHESVQVLKGPKCKDVVKRFLSLLLDVPMTNDNEVRDAMRDVLIPQNTITLTHVQQMLTEKMWTDFPDEVKHALALLPMLQNFKEFSDMVGSELWQKPLTNQQWDPLISRVFPNCVLFDARVRHERRLHDRVPMDYSTFEKALKAKNNQIEDDEVVKQWNKLKSVEVGRQVT